MTLPFLDRRSLYRCPFVTVVSQNFILIHYLRRFYIKFAQSSLSELCIKNVIHLKRGSWTLAWCTFSPNFLIFISMQFAQSRQCQPYYHCRILVPVNYSEVWCTFWPNFLIFAYNLHNLSRLCKKNVIDLRKSYLSHLNSFIGSKSSQNPPHVPSARSPSQTSHSSSSFFINTP